jgi:putative sigma-54 modulation protein
MTLTRKQKVAEFGQGYSISVTGRHIHVTDAMKAYAEQKVSKLEKFGNRIIDVAVTMDIQKLQHKVDIVLKYGHTLIKSSAWSTDMYVSIDQAVDKLEAQLNKYRSRLHEHHLKAYPVVEVPETVYYRGLETVDEQEVNQAIEAQETLSTSFVQHQIVSVEHQTLKILTDLEALMKMELSKASVMVFRDEATRKLKVIYRRDDGNFGIIQPE